MDYKTIAKNITLCLAIIAAVCIIAIFITETLLITTSLKEAVIAEIVGSGILGGIVSSVFFYLQELTSYQSSLSKSKFLRGKLKLDIKEANDRGASYWNLSGGNKFYFDYSIINSLHDIYENNYSSIEQYSDYLKDDKLVVLFGKIYIKTREGYVLGEKIENLLRQIVRTAHHKKGLIAANDSPTVAYLKAKLVTDIPDDGIIKHLEWSSVPERAIEILNQIKSDNDTMKLIKEVIKLRIEIMGEIKNLLKIL